jgi:hypothetical protein
VQLEPLLSAIESLSARSVHQGVRARTSPARSRIVMPSGLQFRTQAVGFLRIHVAHVAPTQALPVTLGQSA